MISQVVLIGLVVSVDGEADLLQASEMVQVRR